MNLLHKFELLAKGKDIKIGIGFGESDFHNKKILKACKSFLNNYNSEIFIFGKKRFVNSLNKQVSTKKAQSKFRIIDCNNPERKIYDFLYNNTIQAIVRGSLSSNKFLKTQKQFLNITDINRLALLETIKGHQFFYGPVGIDECNTIERKKIFIENALKQFETLEITPKISILSGGRESDIGRDAKVDETIRDAENLVQILKEKYLGLSVTHDEILIENAIEKKSNLIIAPDGVSGNLIYRTLVHLGGGKAYGAIYMGIEKIIIDTSRVGNLSEIYGALLLGLALAK
ncbi:MAG: methanogenesis marker protein Mmp4/MtxX [Promethearchaeota archaeon]